MKTRNVVTLLTALMPLSSVAGTFVPATVYKPYPACEQLKCSPKPNPYPLPDDCRHRPCEPKPIDALNTLGSTGSGISAALGNQDFNAAGSALEALFVGGAANSSDEAAPVFVGGLSRPTLVDCGDKKGCKSPLGGNVEAAVEPIVKGIDKLGDHLRDRNDGKLKPKKMNFGAEKRPKTELENTVEDAVGAVIKGVDKLGDHLRDRNDDKLKPKKMSCGDKEGCKSNLGKTVEDAVKPITDGIDRLGDHLRDRNDGKLKPKGKN